MTRNEKEEEGKEEAGKEEERISTCVINARVRGTAKAYVATSPASLKKYCIGNFG